MTQSYYPFDSGAGANVNELQWAKMAQHWLNTGVIKSVLNELQVYADSTGLQTKIKSGAAHIKGHYFESDAEEVLAIGTADGSNPRIDRVIVRLDWTANTIQLAVLQGTAAVSPVAPTLTQNTSRWEIGLAQVRVDAGVTTIASGKVTDERNFVRNANGVHPVWSGLSTLNGWVSTNLSYYETKIFKDDSGVVFFNGGRIKSGVTTNGTTIVNIPAGYRPLKRVIWREGDVIFELDGATGNLTGFNLDAADTIVGSRSWRAEQ